MSCTRASRLVFRVALSAVVLLLVTSLNSTVVLASVSWTAYLSAFEESLQTFGLGPPKSWFTMLSPELNVLIVIAVGISVSAAVILAIRRRDRSGLVRMKKCKNCGYNLTEAQTHCPKCGWRESQASLTGALTSQPPVSTKCAKCGSAPVFKESWGSLVCEKCDVRVCPSCGGQLTIEHASSEFICERCGKKESELLTRLTGDISVQTPLQATEQREATETGQLVYCHYCGAPMPTDAVFCRKCGKSQTVSKS